MSDLILNGKPNPSFAGLPSVDRVLRSELGEHTVSRFGRQAAVKAIRRVLDLARIAVGDGVAQTPCPADVATEALQFLEKDAQPSLRRVFNLTGTVLHTNLGRALIPETAIAAATTAMRSAVALEFDLDTGQRGERDDHARDLIRELTGAEDAVLVNNNAAAVVLLLNTLSLGRETIVSRGELIEIGGSFRLPDIMSSAGARLVEVGTTNRTRLRDFEKAICADTALLMQVHTSNYVVQGFTAAVAASDLAALARSRDLPLVNDLGSGTLIDLAGFGLRPEPTVAQTLRGGADLVTFSGDKLLGGPQCGIIAGRRDLIQRITRNPLKRAMRLDKVRLAILEATLKLYRDPARLTDTLPTLRLLLRAASEIQPLADRLTAQLAPALGADFDVRVVPCASQIGSGALPLESLPSVGITIRPHDNRHSGRRLAALARALRGLPIPVIGRISDGALVLDCRCLDDEADFIAQLREFRVALMTKSGTG